jgi:hypothetical protein
MTKAAGRIPMSKHTRVAVCLAALLGLSLLSNPAPAHDIPNEIIVQSFVKPESDRLPFLVRIPLVMLQSMGLPKRGPGYLDLARIGDGLNKAAQAVTRDIQLYEDGTRLTPGRVQTRVSQPSERLFETFEQARTHITGPKLPESTNVFWNQGFFDAYLSYPIRSDRSEFSLDMQMAPALSGRLKMTVRFMPPEGFTRAYEIHGGFGRLALDPRWHQVAGVFVKSGFFHILDGTDHLLFLFCLVIPFRRRWWDLFKIITAFTVAHTITLIASAQGLVPVGDWFPPLVETLIAASIVYMALENIVAADLRRRWLVTVAFGLVHGFGFSFAFQQDLQFAGDHLLLSLVSFNVGVELGQILVLLLVLPVLGLLFRRRSVERFGVVILSVFLAHTGWHWMVDRVESLRRVDWPTLDANSVVTLAGWGLLLLLVGGVAWAIVKQRKRRLAAQRRAGDGLT